MTLASCGFYFRVNLLNRGLAAWSLLRAQYPCALIGFKGTEIQLSVPGVPDKSSRGLGSMSRYSAQILICFIAYIFLFFFFPLWVWLGTLQDCQYAQCPLPLSIVIRMRLVIRQSKLPACLAEMQLVHQKILWHLSHSLVKMTDKMDEICINRKFSALEPSE